MSMQTNFKTAFHISDKEFSTFQTMIFDLAGITLGDGKKSLVAGRLNKRLRYHKLGDFSQYINIIKANKNSKETQVMIDLLTTNETYFFREEKHFNLLKDKILPEFKAKKHVRIWSAASSSGEEAYTLSMLLTESRGTGGWDILGTDLSQRILEKASKALYPLDAMNKIPNDYLHKYCLKGTRSQEGYLLIDKSLRNNVRFQHMNLNGDWPDIGFFDAVFLRNVMIYFNQATKCELIKKIITRLHTGGYLFIGHAETLNGISHELKLIQPSVFQKIG